MKGRYYQKKINGMLYATEDVANIRPNAMHVGEIVLRLSHDNRGTTLSLAAEPLGVQLTIPLEPVREVLEVK